MEFQFLRKIFNPRRFFNLADFLILVEPLNREQCLTRLRFGPSRVT